MAGENFGEFGDLLRISQSFIRQLLVISEKAIEAGLNQPKFSSPNAIQLVIPQSFLPPKFSAIRYMYNSESLPDSSSGSL